MKKFFLAACLSVPALAFTALSGSAYAQSTISGDLVGTVVDPTGAVIPGAKVTATNTATGITASAVSGAKGEYRLSLLKPGNYSVKVTAAGFGTNENVVAISSGSISNLESRLTTGSASTVIEVSDAAPLLQTEDAQITTTFSQEQVQALPNPGGDITYYAQTAPGVVMNTGGGYGNFSVFGLPGTSNNFTVNGEQENDPFLNLNNSGPTNLLLGQNDISSVSVITSAYQAEFGSFGGAQINEISRSGANKFHGDAAYLWNGRDLNANNWFSNNAGVGRFFSNDNQWSASLGGPIFKDKTFFFVNTEGLRFITAPTDTNYIPSAAYQASVVGADGSCTTGSLAAAGNAVSCGLYNKIFALYNNAPGAASRTSVDADTDTFVSNPKTFAKESLVTARVDHVIGLKDSAFAHFKYDNGTQPTDVDPISSVFNAVSYQPEYEGQLVETHTFSPNLVNQFLFTIAHYGAYFQSVNQSAATTALPFTLLWEDEFFNTLGGAGYAFPQGRNATQYQFADDLSWTKGAHQIKVGYAWKKDDITNFDTGVYTNPLVFAFNNAEADGLPATADFPKGYAYDFRQAFPDNLSNPNALYSEGFYAQDSYKVSPKLLVTAGMRFEHNSNPICGHNCFSRLNTDLGTYLGSAAAGDPTTAYNSIVAYGLKNAFNKFQAVSYQPRFEVTYSPTEKTVIRAGFGMFSDVFPGQVADNLLRNIPQDPRFDARYGLLDPSQPASGAVEAATSAAIFKSGAVTNFYNGGSYSSLHAAAPGFRRPNLSTAAQSVKFPTYEEYSLQIQRAITPSTTVQLAYAGNHGYHEPIVAANSNAYNLGNEFTGIPDALPSQAFNSITNLSSAANSNYNGAIVSVVHRSKHVSAQLNYTYSHTMDQISNGGFLGFTGSAITGPLAPNTLAYNYGNADYDIRHSLNGNYLVNIPGYGSNLLPSSHRRMAGCRHCVLPRRLSLHSHRQQRVQRLRKLHWRRTGASNGQPDS